MDILDKFLVFLLQGLVYVPLYAVLFCHFLNYANVKKKLWKRSSILAITTYCLLSVLSIAFGMFSAAWIGYAVGALMIAYILTKLLIVPYHNAVVAAILIVIVGYDIPPLVFDIINKNVIPHI